MKQSKTCTKIIKLWYLSGYWSFHKFIRISSYSLPTPHLIITGKLVHFKLENLGDRNSLIDLRSLKLDDKGLDWSWNVKVFIIWWTKIKFSVLLSSDELTHCIHNLWYLIWYLSTSFILHHSSKRKTFILVSWESSWESKKKISSIPPPGEGLISGFYLLLGI